MDTKLRILIIDDSDKDAELIRSEIDLSGIYSEYDTAMTKSQIAIALQNNEYDVIICDYELIDTNALEVLSCYKQASLDIPFIGTSGVVTEQRLVELVKAGAHGFFLKKNLDLLPDIILNERKDYLRRVEKKETDENLKLIESLKTRGELIHKPATEFSRMFNVIIGNLHIAQAETLPEECAKAIALAQDAANKALKIAISMLICSGKTTRIVDLINLFDFFNDNAYYFKMLVPKSINLKIDAGTGFPQILGDKTMLRHVIAAVIANSVEAIHEAPKNVNSIVIQVLTQNNDVVISIEDNGCGIEQKLINQVFDPFFSTKISSCGLGLASAFGIVTAHGGTIGIESTVTVGTKVSISLPMKLDELPTDP